METIIVYFTGRGNSLKAAQDIAARLGETTLIPFKDAIKWESQLKAERIGFVFPVINFGIPAHLSEFIKKLVRNKSNQYYFAVVLNGGMPAGTLNQVETLLRSSKNELSAAFLVDVRILLGILGNWQETLEEIATTIKNKATTSINKGTFIDRYVRTGLLNNISSLIVHKADKNFWIDANCDGCPVCANLCPVNNIELQNGKPVWLHRCDQCFGCYARCPQKAIHQGKKDNEQLRQANPDINPDFQAMAASEIGNDLFVLKSPVDLG
jgi:Pyruvate/2-oxoacid:ferredoxin oxidoreductase delta subunit